MSAVATTLTLLSSCDLPSAKREPVSGLDSAVQRAEPLRPSTLEASSAASALPVEAGAGAYPPARWRLVPSVSLAPCVVWVSHILIRHQGVPEGNAAFDHLPLPWTPEPAAPARTREQARTLAEAVAREAQLSPARFAELARTHSEDVTTRDEGGTLGGVSAATLRHWPQVLDALDALRPGEVSRPVETEFGFHIFMRRAPPDEQAVSGRRIVIAYDEAPWVPQVLAGRTIPHRSHGEAEVLARDLFERARRGTGDFEDLVARYSDHEELVRGGDFGQWSSRESTPFAREVERLVSLDIDEISPPLDTVFGFQIIQRTANRARPQQAFASIRWWVDPKAPDSSPQSPSATLARLGEIARLLQLAPQRFEEFQAASCCLGEVEQWEQGRDSAPMEHLLAGLEVGQIAAKPAKLSEMQYAVIQRRAPGPVAASEQCIDLPSPAEADIASFFLTTGQLDLLQQSQQAAQRELNLNEDVRLAFAALHQIQPAWDGAETVDARRQLLEKLGASLIALVGERDARRYHEILARHVERALLREGPTVWP
jgi:PPIC-type peptidyl-prolyl cis-trans isomerase-like protein